MLFESKSTRRRAVIPLTKLYFEAWSVNLDRLSDPEIELVVNRRGAVLSEFTNLMKDPEFDVSVTAGTGSPPKVRRRFNDIRDLLIRVLS